MPSFAHRADEPRKHSGRIRELFPTLTIIIATVALLFIGSAIAAIVTGGLTHFHEAITSAEVLFSLRMSVVTSVISTAICLVLALPTAYALSHTNMPCKRIASILMELTLSLPYILLGFALLLIFSSPFGKALKDMGLAVVFQPAGIVFAQLIVNLPFAIRMMRTALEEINPRMEFVAKTLGASSWQVFRSIILPQARNSIISCAVLTWARAMGEFGATLMLVGVTRMKTETLPGSIYLSISTGNNDVAMATAMIMLIVSALTLVLASVLNRPVGATRVSGATPHGHFGRCGAKQCDRPANSLDGLATTPFEEESYGR
ncbi:MAG: ABC transporter permease [Coriobacteriales bacterium]